MQFFNGYLSTSNRVGQAAAAYTAPVDGKIWLLVLRLKAKDGDLSGADGCDERAHLVRSSQRLLGVLTLFLHR